LNPFISPRSSRPAEGPENDRTRLVSGRLPRSRDTQFPNPESRGLGSSSATASSNNVALGWGRCAPAAASPEQPSALPFNLGRLFGDRPDRSAPVFLGSNSHCRPTTPCAGTSVSEDCGSCRTRAPLGHLPREGRADAYSSLSAFTSSSALVVSIFRTAESLLRRA
jgi:hypothetical protein